MKAPNFQLLDQNGNFKSTKDYAGQWLIVYFYPKDNTPGCTLEACNFRDARDVLEELGNCKIIGISKDSVKSHLNFAKKHNLHFSLLSDPSADTIKAFGAWGTKKFMGKTYEGIKRNTYIVDPSGNIVKTYENVNPLTHVNTILADLRTLQKA